MNRYKRKQEAMRNKKLEQLKMKRELARLTLGDKSNKLTFETETITCQQKFDYWHQMRDSVRYGEHIKNLIVRSISEKLYDFADLKTEGDMIRCEILVAKKVHK